MRARLFSITSIVKGFLGSVAFPTGVIIALLTPVVFAERSEDILGFHSDNDRLVFRVQTNGCTRKEDFAVNIRPSIPDVNEISITLFRLRRDECKGFFREGTEIVFTRQELSLPQEARIRVTNAEIR